MERQDFHRGRGVQLVLRADEGLGQRENTKIHESSGESADTMAQGAHVDRPTDGRRRVSPWRHLRPSHRRDETTGSARRMGEHCQPGGGNVECRGREPEAAPSEYSTAIYRFSSVQARAAAPAHAAADSRALRRRTPLAEDGTVKITIAPRESSEQYREAIKEFREIFGL